MCIWESYRCTLATSSSTRSARLQGNGVLVKRYAKCMVSTTFLTYFPLTTYKLYACHLLLDDESEFLKGSACLCLALWTLRDLGQGFISKNPTVPMLSNG